MKIVQDNLQARWQEYRDLRIQALKDVPQAFLGTPAEAKEISQKEWQKKIKNMYFAEVDGKWVGMIGAYQDEKQKVKHIMNVVSFYVLPDFRGRGIGRALLHEVVDQAKRAPGIKKFELGVITTQEAAYQLYLSLGFKKIGTKKHAVRVGDKYFDEFLMEKMFLQ